MPIPIEDQITELLYRNAHQNLTLLQLHALLVREIGYAAGSYHELRERLKNSQPRFLLLDHADPLAEGAGWTQEVREAYVTALDRAGVDLSPVISLAAAQSECEAGDVVGLLRSTLLRLSERLVHDPAAREDLIAALAGLTRMPRAVRTTTLLRDPRSPG